MAAEMNWFFRSKPVLANGVRNSCHHLNACQRVAGLLRIQLLRNKPGLKPDAFAKCMQL